MNCHKNNRENNGSHKHSLVKHMFHMILCCGLPIVILLLLPFISRVSPVTSGVLAVITPFICPIMMGSMVVMMFMNNKKKSCCSNENKENTNNEGLIK